MRTPLRVAVPTRTAPMVKMTSIVVRVVAGVARAGTKQGEEGGVDSSAD
jgi:hypothetical protein